jgi:alcohol dehydrogenase
MSEIAPFQFLHSTRRIAFGQGSIDTLAEIAEQHGCRSAAFVVDGFVTTSGLADTLGQQLSALAPRFHAIPPEEPDTEAVEAARAFLAEAEPDMVVAIGGGSAMDAAKVARMRLSNPGDITDIVGPVGVTMAPHRSLFVCAPTTAGTGSEVSESAVITAAGTDYKMIFRSAEMSADIAVLDPALSVSAPAGVTAASGYDAVTHAVEAFTSKAANPLTDAMARSAMQLLAQSLPVAHAEPDNLAARSACLVGSMQAAIAFNSANLGLAHAVSGALGALHHVAHGLGNALALPWTMAFNQPTLGEKGEEIAGLFGGETAAEGLSVLRKRLGLDISLDEFVRTDGERDALAKGATKSGQVRFNPRLADEQQLRVIVEAMRRPTDGGPPHLNL